MQSMSYAPHNENAVKLTPLLFMLILAQGTLAQIAADMYVPSLPAITIALKSNHSLIQMTMAIFMFGYGISNLFYGPVSDRIGRRNPILFGIALNAIGSLICFIAPSAMILIIGRFVQGLGVGVCNSVGRSVSRDLFHGNHLARIASLIGMIASFMLAAAPLLGGYIQHYFEWRANFLFLFIYSLLIWILIWRKLPETNQHLNPDATKIKVVLQNYLILFSSKTFVGFALCSGLAYAGFVAYLTSAPFLLQNIVGLTAVQFGWLAFLVASSLFISAVLNSKFVLEIGISIMILIGNYLMLASGIVMLIFALLGFMNTFVIMFPVTLFVMGAGLTFSNAFAGAFHPFPKMAGSAGGLYGCLQTLAGSLASALMATLHRDNQIPLAVIFIVLGLLALFCLRMTKQEPETA